jgi:uncharacterized LabA/DUF88 family protein
MKSASRKKKKESEIGPFLPVFSPINPLRWMLFVDGENFTFRGQEIAKLNDIELKVSAYYEPDVFLWLPDTPGRESIVPNAPVGIQPVAIRAHYYTSAVGDVEKLDSIKEKLWALGFHPEVFKKDKKQTKSKGVDISLAKDFICNAYMNNYDAAVLIAGDADFIPIVDEVKRLGKLVYVISFHGDKSGLSRKLQIAADVFFRINESFLESWSNFEE